MADDRTKASQNDDDRINIEQHDEVKYWAEWCLPLRATQDFSSSAHKEPREGTEPYPSAVRKGPD
jgi:hypothetical protein